MAGGTVSRTAHFVLHRRPLETAAAGMAAADAALLQLRPGVWMGALLPKRWARRAVTRNGIRRQIYAVGQACQASLAPAAHVVRLRAGFDTQQFVSAWSDPLKAAVRAELQTLFLQARPLVPVAAASTSALP